MGPDTVEKIFEPFFTTKDVGKGTGLGLATSLAIVRSHGGFMQVYSEPGRGTRFTVGLPVSSSPRSDSTVTRRPEVPLPRGHGERILVVDDEATILQITCQTLELNGYRTLRAANGREAIDVIASSSESVDLVLTDMMMPVMDGAALSAHLEQEHPEIPVIAASGLNSNGGVARAVGMGVSRFLPKPYTTSLLVTTVRDTLLEHRVKGMVTG
jgi:two-component system, cell cycle sensor histidine kinase and response regulator CckA